MKRIVEAKWLKCDIFNSSKGRFSTVKEEMKNFRRTQRFGFIFDKIIKSYWSRFIQLNVLSWVRLYPCQISLSYKVTWFSIKLWLDSTLFMNPRLPYVSFGSFWDIKRKTWDQSVIKQCSANQILNASLLI